MRQNDRSSADLASADLAIGTGRLLLFAPPARVEVVRYTASAALVLAVALACASILNVSFRMPDQVSETDSVVMVDLPPAASATAPLRDAADGPEQAASQATPETSAPPVEQPKPIEEQKPPAMDNPAPTPPPPEMRQPDAALPPKEEAAAPARPAAAAPAPQVEEQAPQGAERSKESRDTDADGEVSQASARALSVWQRSMVSKLEGAKKAFRRHGGREGTVQVAFSIDRDGRLVRESVDKSSGNTFLDDMAKRVVRKAEPYPAPPAGARDADLSFTVPIHFKR